MSVLPPFIDRASHAPEPDRTPPWATLPDIPGGWTVSRCHRSDLHRGDRRHLEFIHPADPDRFLDDPQVLEANRLDDYMPYWAYLWPSAGWMGSALSQANWPPDTEVLELGCGLGLVGLSALAAGWRVTFSDYDSLTVACALCSARHNGWADRASGLALDWRKPVDRQWPVILGNDLTYETRNHAVLLDLLSAMLTPDGVCWLGDPGRMPTAEFIPFAENRGWQIDRLDPGSPDSAPTAPVTPAGAKLLILRRKRA